MTAMKIGCPVLEMRFFRSSASDLLSCGSDVKTEDSLSPLIASPIGSAAFAVDHGVARTRSASAPVVAARRRRFGTASLLLGWDDPRLLPRLGERVRLRCVGPGRR